MSNIKGEKLLNQGSKGVKENAVDKGVGGPAIPDSPTVNIGGIGGQPSGSEVAPTASRYGGASVPVGQQEVVVVPDGPDAQGQRNSMPRMDFESLKPKPVVVDSVRAPVENTSGVASDSGKELPKQPAAPTVVGAPAGAPTQPTQPKPAGAPIGGTAVETSGVFVPEDVDDLDDDGVELTDQDPNEKPKFDPWGLDGAKSDFIPGEDSPDDEVVDAPDEGSGRSTGEPSGVHGESPSFADVFDYVKKGKVVAFTGHRPVDPKTKRIMLPSGYSESGDDFKKMKLALEDSIRYAYHRGARTFITGMAIGTDMIAAELVLKFKDSNPDVVLVAAIPFPGHKNPKWPAATQRRYDRILLSIPGGYVDPVAPTSNIRDAFNRRNSAMVERADLVIALFDGTPSGTADTVRKATAAGVPIISIEPMTAEASVITDGKKRSVDIAALARQAEKEAYDNAEVPAGSEVPSTSATTKGDRTPPQGLNSDEREEYMYTPFKDVVDAGMLEEWRAVGGWSEVNRDKFYSILIGHQFDLQSNMKMLERLSPKLRSWLLEQNDIAGKARRARNFAERDAKQAAYIAAQEADRTSKPEGFREEDFDDNEPSQADEDRALNEYDGEGDEPVQTDEQVLPEDVLIGDPDYVEKIPGEDGGDIEEDLIEYELAVYDWLKGLDTFMFDSPEDALQHAIDEASQDTKEFLQKYKDDIRLKSALKHAHENLLEEAVEMFEGTKTNLSAGIVDEYFAEALAAVRFMDPSPFESYQDFAKAALLEVGNRHDSNYLKAVYGSPSTILEPAQNNLLGEAEAVWLFGHGKLSDSDAAALLESSAQMYRGMTDEMLDAARKSFGFNAPNSAKEAQINSIRLSAIEAEMVRRLAGGVQEEPAESGTKEETDAGGRFGFMPELEVDDDADPNEEYNEPSFGESTSANSDQSSTGASDPFADAFVGEDSTQEESKNEQRGNRSQGRRSRGNKSREDNNYQQRRTPEEQAEYNRQMRGRKLVKELTASNRILPELLDTKPAVRIAAIDKAVRDYFKMMDDFGIYGIEEDPSWKRDVKIAREILEDAGQMKRLMLNITERSWSLLEGLFTSADNFDENGEMGSALEYLMFKEVFSPTEDRLWTNPWAIRASLAVQEVVGESMLSAKSVNDTWNALTDSMDKDRVVALIIRNDRKWYRTHGEKGAQSSAESEREFLRPRKWDKFIKTSRGIIREIMSGSLELTGDHEEQRAKYSLAHDGSTVVDYVTVKARSQEVYDAVSAHLEQVGAGHIDPKNHTELDVYIKKINPAVMMYRGLSKDMSRKLFGKKVEDGGKLKDSAYIKTLREMVGNVQGGESGTGYNNVFAFHPSSELGGTRAFSLPITREVAEFYAGFPGSNPTGASVEEYMDYTVEQFNDKVKPLLEEDGNKPQQVVMRMFVHAITLLQPEIAGYGRSEDDSGRPTIPMVSPEDFETLSEMYDVTSFYANASRPGNEMRNAATDTRERVIASSAEVGATSRKWRNSTKASKLTQRVFDSLNNIAVFNQIAFLAQGGTSVTAMAEREDNLLRSGVHVKARQRLAAKRLGVDVKPSASMLEKIVGPKPLAAIDDALKFLTSVDSAFLLNMVAQNPGVVFGAGAFDQVNDERKKLIINGSVDEKSKLALEEIVAKMAAFTNGSADLALSVMAAGDFIGKKKFARLWLKYYMLEMADAAASGRPTLTPEEIERMYDNGEDDFFRTAFGSIEGQQAMVKAMHGMLNGYNYATYKIGKTLENPATRFLVGFVATHFARFQTNSLFRVVAGSTTGLYLAKYGVNRVHYKESQDGSEYDQAKARGWISTTNQMQFGGDHLGADRLDYSKRLGEMTEEEQKEFWRGFNECMYVDSVNSAISGTYVVGMIGILLAAGIEPPDDTRLMYDFTEWKVGTNIRPGGWTISMSWVLDDLSRGMMPAVFGIAAAIWGMQQKDMSTSESVNLAMNIYTAGTVDVISKNKWVQLMGIADAAKAIIGAEDHRATVNEDVEYTDGDRILSEIEMALLRRTTVMFEPAVWREIYSGRGIFAPDSQYDVSTSQIYTLDPTDDETKTEATTYRDSRLRKETKRSWLAGTIANFATQLTGDNADQRTGYLRGDMPTLMNADPVHLMWSDKLTPKDGDTPIDFEPTNDESVALYAPIVEELRNIIENPEYTPQILAASGLMIPYNARKALSFQYDLEVELMWREYYARKANGDWINHDSYGSPEHIRLAQAQNAAYEKIQRREAEVYNIKQKLWSNTIPYSPRKLVRGLTDFRTVKVWKKGTPKEGKPVGAIEMITPANQDNIETRLYPVGNVRSAWKPFTAVRDDGDPSYDYRAKLGWNNEMTDEEFVKNTTSGYVAVSGVGKGEDMFELVTGGGATGPGATKAGNWTSDEFLFALRGYFDLEPTYEDIEMPEFDWDEILGKDPNEDKGDDDGKAEVPNGSNGGWSNWSSGGAGWSESVQDIYSHAGGNLNYDRPSMMRTRNSEYVRFDYLRPSVKTKGSREAYRREDF